MDTQKKELFQFMIAPDLKKWVETYADENGISMSSVMRIALSQLRHGKEQDAAEMSMLDAKIERKIVEILMR